MTHEPTGYEPEIDPGEDCPECEGEGSVDGEPCSLCEGTGDDPPRCSQCRRNYAERGFHTGQWTICDECAGYV